LSPSIISKSPPGQLKDKGYVGDIWGQSLRLDVGLEDAAYLEVVATTLNELLDAIQPDLVLYGAVVIEVAVHLYHQYF